MNITLAPDGRMVSIYPWKIFWQKDPANDSENNLHGENVSSAFKFKLSTKAKYHLSWRI